MACDEAIWVYQCPVTFQCLMNEIFQGILQKFVLVFFEEILIYSPTWSAHLQHLQHFEVILQILRKHHAVSGNGVTMDNKKVQAVLR